MRAVTFLLGQRTMRAFILWTFPAMKSRALIILYFLLFSCSALAQSIERVALSIGLFRIDAEVAADQENRMRGLMNRRSMAPQQGMLFVFPEIGRHCMWMRNTYIPLSVAFLDQEGRIVNIEDMQPQTEDNHCASRPARYALEMNLGWFSSKGIKPGARLSGLEKAPAPH
ncbi:MAG: hypothetical protein BWY57_01566 [Betaproteobacteria bacterium ADurb.Bin341]|nr:MAG: hypothetical protein BWY57_01566 [Betaproteobacteria bacterium ADurb.Bin341]